MEWIFYEQRKRFVKKTKNKSHQPIKSIGYINIAAVDQCCGHNMSHYVKRNSKYMLIML